MLRTSLSRVSVRGRVGGIGSGLSTRTRGRVAVALVGRYDSIRLFITTPRLNALRVSSIDEESGREDVEKSIASTEQTEFEHAVVSTFDLFSIGGESIHDASYTYDWLTMGVCLQSNQLDRAALTLSDPCGQGRSSSMISSNSVYLTKSKL